MTAETNLTPPSSRCNQRVFSECFWDAPIFALDALECGVLDKCVMCIHMVPAGFVGVPYLLTATMASLNMLSTSFQVFNLKMMLPDPTSTLLA